MCLALVACGVATPEAHTAHVAEGDRVATTDALPSSGPDALGVAQPAGQGSRLGPPSPRGVGLRRVDRAASASPGAARY
jgi:hypothetical protein